MASNEKKSADSFSKLVGDIRFVMIFWMSMDHWVVPIKEKEKKFVISQERVVGPFWSIWQPKKRRGNVAYQQKKTKA